jgi:hypothetical protein
MKGPMADPCVRNTSPLSSTSITRIGVSQNFLRVRRKLQNSKKKDTQKLPELP